MFSAENLCRKGGRYVRSARQKQETSRINTASDVCIIAGPVRELCAVITYSKKTGEDHAHQGNGAQSEKRRRKGEHVRKDKDFYNAEGYPDPTAYQGIRNAMFEQKAMHDHVNATIGTIRGVAKLAGFEIEGRITLRDIRTGKEYH